MSDGFGFSTCEVLERRVLLSVSWSSGGTHGVAPSPASAAVVNTRPRKTKPVSGASLQPVDAAPPVTGGWNNIFSDNFQTQNTLSSVWTRHMWWSQGATKGDGLEVDDPANVSIKRGTGVVFTVTHGSGGYKSGLIQTGGIQGRSTPSFSFEYGFAAARIKFPVGQGLWPAFWMLPEATPSGSTDQDKLGEVDALDDGSGNPNAVHAGVGRFGLNYSAGIDTPNPGPTVSAGWHTIGVDWEPDHITFFVDGKAWASTSDTTLIPTTPEYLILNLSAGGAWSQGDKRTLNSHTKLPATMAVAWVQVWQNSQSAST